MSGIPKDWWDLPQVVARSLVGMPQPDPLSADEAEHGVCALPELTESEMAEGHLTEERR